MDHRLSRRLKGAEGTGALACCEGSLGSRERGSPGGFVDARKRTCGCEGMCKSILCFGMKTRHPRVHVLLSLPAPCQE